MYYVFLYCIYTAGIASNKSQIDKAWKKPEKDIVSLLHRIFASCFSLLMKKKHIFVFLLLQTYEMIIEISI